MDYEGGGSKYWQALGQAPPPETNWRDARVPPPPPSAAAVTPQGPSALIPDATLNAVRPSGEVVSVLPWEGPDGGDARMRALVPMLNAENNPSQWPLVATHIFGRTAGECRDRYRVASNEFGASAAAGISTADAAAALPTRARGHRRPCGACINCLRPACNQCDHCLKRQLRKRCKLRKCLAPRPAATATNISSGPTTFAGNPHSEVKRGPEALLEVPAAKKRKRLASLHWDTGIQRWWNGLTPALQAHFRPCLASPLEAKLCRPANDGSASSVSVNDGSASSVSVNDGSASSVSVNDGQRPANDGWQWTPLHDSAAAVSAEAVRSQEVAPGPSSEEWVAAQAQLELFLPFACPHDGCRRRERWHAKLARHALAHTGEKPHICDFPGCSKHFSLKHNLKSHRKTHDKPPLLPSLPSPSPPPPPLPLPLPPPPPSLPQRFTAKVRLPSGATEGQRCRALLEDGTKAAFVVPAGVQPGQVITVSYLRPGSTSMKRTRTTCSACLSADVKILGGGTHGYYRYLCRTCGATWQQERQVKDVHHQPAPQRHDSGGLAATVTGALSTTSCTAAPKPDANPGASAVSAAPNIADVANVLDAVSSVIAHATKALSAESLSGR